jgi:MoxR-like ATPase
MEINTSENPIQKQAITNTERTVSYLGVGLPKAENRDSQFVPKIEQYNDFINDKFSLDLQKQIAVSLLQGDPLLIEGGTSIGKTTTVRKMAAELGYEVHYANLNGATDVEDLMGRYVPNPNKKTDNDPEYVFADGKITSGLRQEEGKTKVIILDEYNSAAPNILIRLHEVLDALQRGDRVVLSEDASENILVDKNKTKIIALTNPPGKGYFGREPLDPAQLRRWVYLKAPSDLPEETFSYSTDALFSLVSQQQEVSNTDFLISRDKALFPEQLQEIPGIANIIEKYKEFHKAAKEFVKERKIAADQPQPFIFDDRMEPKRVRDFVLAFYNGDINETFQKALRYYYSNKLESEVDRAKLEEIIQHVEYIAPQNVSQRKGIDEEVSTTTADVSENPSHKREEKSEWNTVLGKLVDIPPLPASITPEVQKNLEKMGMELRFIPSLNLDTIKELKKLDVEKYLDSLQSHYPNWHRYESLNDTQKNDHSVSRNIEEWYWGLVKDGKVDFPSLPGKWIAVETMPKPADGDHYASSKISKMLGFEDRFNVSWNDANEAIKREKKNILKEAGLVSGEVRMLEAIEWNLLANREGWGSTNTYEWTNTELRDDGGSRRLFVGGPVVGGAAHADSNHPEGSGGSLVFRLAVVF